MTLSGYVLAGGRSSRMGFDKARAPCAGWPLALCSYEALASVCEEVWLVRRAPSDGWPWLGRDGESLPVLWEPEEPSRHPLLGVAFALEQAQTSLAIFMPCDAPGVGPDVIRRMADRGPCVLWDGENVHPLCVVLPVTWAGRVRHLAREGASAKRLVTSLPRVLATDQELRNVNHWQDLLDLEENLGMRTPHPEDQVRMREERGVIWGEPV